MISNILDESGALPFSDIKCEIIAFNVVFSSVNEYIWL